ncbi:MarR family winged helix-turn-helix transcriptional regulator [Saccharibacillus sacchari]|uniref:MarR family winged helix-turn-helix transcriptional regulator n=1 Tax=Saccharibacillus sacchari TaxID=456493 RepID=UPI0004B3B515|nr:MarR family transcriptional regulator [Saccharibacillus sacchari]
MDLYSVTGFLVHRTDVKMTNYFMKRLKQYAITPEQWSLISYLNTEHALTQKELAIAIDRDQTTIVRMIHSLVKKDMVRKVVNDGDRRSHELYLSEKGAALKEQLIETVREAHEHITRGLSEQEIEQLHALLNRLYINATE